jgi:hypothetical protein
MDQSFEGLKQLSLLMFEFAMRVKQEQEADKRVVDAVCEGEGKAHAERYARRRATEAREKAEAALKNAYTQFEACRP